MTSPSRPDLRQEVTFFFAGLLVFGVAAAAIPAPGYMDAEYYHSTGQMLASGAGFSEPFIWNFLADPAGLPTPSHAYWMPIASLVAAAPMAVFGSGFRTAQAAFVLLAACLPVLTVRMAKVLGAGRGVVWLAGSLALLPGFYAPFFVTTDTFAVFAVIGGALLWQLAEAATRPSSGRWLLIGLLIGLGHLTRADGLLLWVPAAVAVAVSPGPRARSLLLALAGYAVIVLPWWARNVAAFGSILPPGSSRALWLVAYDDLFSYPASLLTPARMLSAGAAAWIGARLEATWANLQSLVVVNASILLLPLILFGGWRLRRHPLVRLAAVYAATLFVFMSLVFPFAGARGGFFHSASALMPLVWALAAVGIDRTAQLAPRLRWEPDGTRRLFAVVAFFVAAALSIWAMAGKVGALGLAASFARNRLVYAEAQSLMEASDGGAANTVAVVNPPGYYAATGVSAVALPNGDTEGLRQVVERFDVDWVVLEADHPFGLGDLYADPTGVVWLGEPLAMNDPAGRKVLVIPVRSEALE